MTKAAELAKMGEVLTNSQIGGRRNLIYNGAQTVAQRSTSETGVGASSGYHTVDRWRVFAEGTAGRLTMSQESITDLEGFAKATKLACTTADTSLAANELLIFSHAFEGQDLQGLEKGFSTAKKVTVSFYVKANASAKYVAELFDADNTRSIQQSFDVTTSWNRIELTFNADTTGKLDNDNALSFYFQIWLHGGSNYTSGTFTSNTWASNTDANRYAASSVTSIVDSTDRTFFITGLQMEIGSQVTPFEHRSFGEELALCQRYLNIFGKTETGNNYENFGTVVAFGTGNGERRMQMTMPTTMRAIPTVTHSGAFACLGQVVFGSSPSIGLADGGSRTIIGLNLTGTQGDTLGDVSPFRSNNDADAFISFDAEL